MLGAGLMGAGIAYVSATAAGIPVRLKDKDSPGVARGLAHVKSLIDGRVKRKRATPREAAEQIGLVSGTTGYDGIRRACMILVKYERSIPLSFAK